MKGRKALFLVFGLFIAVSSLISPVRAAALPPQPDGKYDYSAALFNGGLEEISSDWPRVFASGTPYLNKKDSEEKTLLAEVNQHGRAIIIPPYVLTLHHIINVNEFEDFMMTPYGPRTIRLPANGLLNESYWLQTSRTGPKINLEKIAFLPEYDLALFKMEQSLTIPFKPMKLGRSSDLKLGNLIFVLGSPRSIGLYIRSGIISALEYHFDQEVMKDIPGSNLIPRGSIGISIPVVGGDSGSPVVALRDGELELVGIAQAGIFGILGIMTPIDTALEKIKEATDIDIREQNETNLKRLKNNGGPK